MAVEVVSPTDTCSEVEAKVESWLTHGVRSCWVVDPKNRRITIYRADGSVMRLKVGQELRDDVLPGFAVAVDRIFE